MDQIYEVSYQGQVRGDVRMDRTGLYWRISCRCDLVKGEILRLFGNFEKGSIDLGLLYPVDGKFGLDTKVSCAKAGNMVSSFTLMDKQRTQIHIPLCESDPVPCLPMLEQCRFLRIDGKPHLILPCEKNG